MNIYLAGDSIVQNYTEEEFIAGWGQFLPRFFKSDVNVFNYAKGGRSSRLFINEGRFEDAKDTYIDMVNMLKERYHVGLINVSSIKVKAK